MSEQREKRLWTPGPWKVGFADGSGIGPLEPWSFRDEGVCITDSKDRVVVMGGDNAGCPVGVRSPQLPLNVPEMKANADLIAGAPGLYEALAGIYAGVINASDDKRVVMNISVEAFKAMEAALAKALGKGVR